MTSNYTRLTPGVEEKIITALRAGNFRSVAAEWAGLSRKTLSNWCRRGRENPDSRYGDFLRAVEQAELEFHVRAVANLAQQAQTNAKAAQWLLARKFPERWSSTANQVRALQKEVGQLRELVTKLTANRNHFPS